MIVHMYIQMVFVLYSTMWPRPHTEATAQYVSTTTDHSVLDKRLDCRQSSMYSKRSVTIISC